MTKTSKIEFNDWFASFRDVSIGWQLGYKNVDNCTWSMSQLNLK